MNASEVAVLRPVPSGFGHFLRELRIAANLTQAELAEQAGVSERLVSDYERGVLHRPRRDTVQLLANGLRLDERNRAKFVKMARGRDLSAAVAVDAPTRRQVNLPLPTGDFVGRDGDIHEVSELVLRQDHRLVTLIGIGGVGKTRLAIETARQLAHAFPDGVYFVDLAPVRDADLVGATIASALEVKVAAGQSALDALVEALHQQETLLVLDNFEHLVAAAADVAGILAQCIRVKVLVTSRAPIRIRAERPYRVEPLTLPDLERLPRYEELSRIPAVRMFVSCAVVADADFALTRDNARAVAEITVKLDGLPLAIELAVARLKVLPPRELSDRLDQRLPMLVGGARDLPERHRAMSAAIAWSYDLLKAEEQHLFRFLAVFSGGFTLEGAETVFALGLPSSNSRAANGPNTLDHLMALVDWSLVKRDESGEARRFSMLESIREYGLDRLSAAEETRIARDGHLRWCIDFLERNAYDELGSQLPEWIRELDSEHDNIRAALEWAIESEQVELAQRICGSCYQYWIHRGLSDEGNRWFERVARMKDDIPLGVLAKALLGQGAIAYVQGRYDQEPLLQQALELFRSIGDEYGVAMTLRALGLFAQDQQSSRKADALEQEALEIFQRLGNHVMATRVLTGLGLNAYDRGDFKDAEALFEEALVQARVQEIWLAVGSILNNLALVVMEYGEYDRAAALQQEALEEWRALRYSEGIAHSLENLARIALRRQQTERGVLLLGAAESARLAIGTPGRLVDREVNERLLGEARGKLDEASYLSAWNRGTSMPADEAIDFALELAGDY